MDANGFVFVFGVLLIAIVVATMVCLERHTSKVYAALDAFLERAKRADTKAELAAIDCEIRKFVKDEGVWHRAQIARASEILAYIIGKSSVLNNHNTK